MLRMEKNWLVVQQEQSGEQWGMKAERERSRSGGPWVHAKGCGFSLREMKTYWRVWSVAMDFHQIILEADLRIGYRDQDRSSETC